jgi:hypothetical protein
VFVGHPCADSAMPSSFSEHHDALTGVPWGLREARRVLGAAPSPPLGLPHQIKIQSHPKPEESDEVTRRLQAAKPLASGSKSQTALSGSRVSVRTHRLCRWFFSPASVVRARLNARPYWPSCSP